MLALSAAAACSSAPPPTPPAAPEPEPQLELRPTAFEQLEGWRLDDPSEALAAFRRSCQVMMVRGDQDPVGPHEVSGRIGDWRPACRAAGELGVEPGAERARRFFETWFQPYRVTDSGDPGGLFTGYFEPLLDGSRRYKPPYTVPLYRPPHDLVRVDLGRFNPDLRGHWIAGRVEGNTFVPYHSRADIAEGALAGQGLELLWVDDPIDKFFLQIQGSGRVQLDDGSVIRVGYAGQNGHPYRAIGRDLIEMGAIPRDQVSLQSIRRWLQANPRDADSIMDRNRSYIFFEERPELDPEDGPLGAQGVPLTAGRSLAVDRRYVPFGAPVWLSTTVPRPGGGETMLRRLMIAQDTGGAIRGVVRGDVFWGAGDFAEEVAGRMKSRGSYALLLPRTLTPVS